MSKISNRFGFIAMATVSASLVLLSATANPASAAVPSQADAERRETLIIDIDGGKVQSPDLFNP
jgi:hypothetical protein